MGPDAMSERGPVKPERDWRYFAEALAWYPGHGLTDGQVFGVVQQIRAALRGGRISQADLWTGPVEVDATCCAAVMPTVQQDCDDPLVFAIVCDSCGADLAFVHNRAPDPCPGHTEQEGPHHSLVCCLYADQHEDDTADIGDAP